MIQNIIFLCSLPVIFGFNLDQTHPPTILGRDEKLRISTLPNTLSFDQQIDWNQGTVYDQSHQPLLTTSPSQMPDLIDIRGGNDDNDQIITSLNLVSCSSSSFLNSWTVFQTLNPLWSDHHHELLIWFITFLIWLIRPLNHVQKRSIPPLEILLLPFNHTSGSSTVANPRVLFTINLYLLQTD